MKTTINIFVSPKGMAPAVESHLALVARLGSPVKRVESQLAMNLVYEADLPDLPRNLGRRSEDVLREYLG